MSSYSLKKLRSESPVHDVPASAQYLSPHTSDISVNREVQSMKKGWNKKGDSNPNAECPIAALLTDGLTLYFDIIGYFGKRSP